MPHVPGHGPTTSEEIERLRRLIAGRPRESTSRPDQPFTTRDTPTTQNPFAGILEEEPRTAFFSRANQFGTSPSRRRFSENAFPGAFDKFLGQLGTQIKEGKAPDLKFDDFLDNSFNFEKEFFQTPRARRRGFAPTVNPRTRFLVQF